MKTKSYISLLRQKGLSLVELMVALTLSLVVMLITTGIYVSNKQTYRFLDSYGSLQENGRFAIYFLREHILQAGFPGQSFVNAFQNLPANNTGPNNSDDINVSFRSLVDCVNVAIPGPAPTTTTNTFTIVQPAGAVPQLHCNGQVLVEGIETMQVAYGVDTDNDFIANTYADSAQVQAGIGGASWNEVVSVRVAILVQGQANTLDIAQAITYNLLGNAYPAANDRTPRRVFTTTIPLRNKNKDFRA